MVYARIICKMLLFHPYLMSPELKEVVRVAVVVVQVVHRTRHRRRGELQVLVLLPPKQTPIRGKKFAFRSSSSMYPPRHEGPAVEGVELAEGGPHGRGGAAGAARRRGQQRRLRGHVQLQRA